MARKKDAEKFDPDKHPVEVAVGAIHGTFSGHPLLEPLKALKSISSKKPGKLQTPEIVAERDVWIRSLGEWLYKVCDGPEDRRREEFQQLMKLVSHISGGFAVNTSLFRTRAAYTKLMTDSGIAPSLAELHAAIGQIETAPDNRTLRRNIKKLRLQLSNHKTKGRFRRTAEELSQGGKIVIDPLELRARLKGRGEKMNPGLPADDNQLIILCAGCGAKIEKSQLVRALMANISRGGRPVSDFDLITTIPRWAREHYDLALLSKLRAYATSIDVHLTKEEGMDRDDPFGPPPRR